MIRWHRFVSTFLAHVAAEPATVVVKAIPVAALKKSI